MKKFKLTEKVSSEFTATFDSYGKLSNPAEIETACIEWSNQMQYDKLKADFAEDKYNGELEYKVQRMEKAPIREWKDTTPFIRAVCIGLGWSFGKFGVPQDFTAVINACDEYHKTESDESRTALKKAVNDYIDSIVSGEVIDGFRSNLSGAKAAKFADACHRLRSKTDSKSETSYTTDTRVNLQACYKEFCMVLVKTIGIYREDKKRTVKVDYMA